MNTTTTLGLLAIEKSSEMISNMSKLIQFKEEPDLSHMEIFEELEKRDKLISDECVHAANQVTASFCQLQSIIDMMIAHGDIPQSVSINPRIIQELKNLEKTQMHLILMMR